MNDSRMYPASKVLCDTCMSCTLIANHTYYEN